MTIASQKKEGICPRCEQKAEWMDIGLRDGNGNPVYTWYCKACSWARHPDPGKGWQKVPRVTYAGEDEED